MRSLAAILLALALAGCATGNTNYSGPTSAESFTNSKLIYRSREAVWNEAVPALGKEFFVINNLDKSSGLINISYSGDPERYIDCGMIHSSVNNMRGHRTWDFPAAKASEQYEALNGIYLLLIDRKMSIDGRMNLIFEAVGPNETRVTANTRYVVNRKSFVQVAGSSASRTFDDTISFNSGGEASFPSEKNGEATTCEANGRFEREVLSLIH